MTSPSSVLVPGDIGTRVKVRVSDNTVSGFLTAYTDSSLSVANDASREGREIPASEIESIELVKVNAPKAIVMGSFVVLFLTFGFVLLFGSNYFNYIS